MNDTAERDALRGRQFAPARALVRRSMLAGAVTSAAHVQTGWEVGADAIMLDLEDTVPRADKDRARALVRDAVEAASRGGGDVIVRINGPWELGEDDLEASVWPKVAAIIVPKVETVDELERVDSKIESLQRSRGFDGEIRTAITIESVAGLMRLRDLVSASERAVSVTLGTEDYTHDIDVEPTADGMETLLPLLSLVVAAREASITPLMGVLGALAGVGDLVAVRRRARWARSVGFLGAACSARTHVPIANEVFTPAPDTVERARRVIAAYEDSTARGEGRIEVDGGVVDTPVVLRAQDLLTRFEQIRAHEERKRVALAANGGSTSHEPA